MRAERRAVGLTAYPEMVVRHPGMRVHRPRGLPGPFGVGPQIQKSWKAKPDGLLLHEGLVWSLIPVHLVRDTIKPSGLARFARETSMAKHPRCLQSLDGALAPISRSRLNNSADSRATAEQVTTDPTAAARRHRALRRLAGWNSC
jgi:hypothetical protein